VNALRARGCLAPTRSRHDDGGGGGGGCCGCARARACGVVGGSCGGGGGGGVDERTRARSAIHRSDGGPSCVVRDREAGRVPGAAGAERRLSGNGPAEERRRLSTRGSPIPEVFCRVRL